MVSLAGWSCSRRTWDRNAWMPNKSNSFSQARTDFLTMPLCWKKNNQQSPASQLSKQFCAIRMSTKPKVPVQQK